VGDTYPHKEGGITVARLKSERGVYPECPMCEESENVIRQGKTHAGSQRFRCRVCNFNWTPEPKEVIPPTVILQQKITELEAENDLLQNRISQLERNVFSAKQLKPINTDGNQA
jgi:predicted RNA-binding Zn-ribbon protein involved in translation (DUF1610 family)